jgi:hypothetical protein
MMVDVGRDGADFAAPRVLTTTTVDPIDDHERGGV